MRAGSSLTETLTSDDCKCMRIVTSSNRIIHESNLPKVSTISGSIEPDGLVQIALVSILAYSYLSVTWRCKDLTSTRSQSG